MTQFENHPELALFRAPDKALVPIELVRVQKHSGAAFSLACQASGLEDKEIYMNPDVDIDAGTFSKIKKGEANLPGNKLKGFCRAVGNTIYAEWLAYQVGCTLVMIETEAERRAREATDKLKVAEDRIKFLTDVLMTGRAA